MIEALAYPEHEERDSFIEWLGGALDQDAFDLQAMHRMLENIR